MIRDLALFNLAIDSKLRGSYLVSLRVHQVVLIRRGRRCDAVVLERYLSFVSSRFASAMASGSSSSA
jgi:hypothetical protein